MEFEENEARNDCAGEGQEQFNQPTAEVQSLWAAAVRSW
jgi:hypothetical protein